MLAALSTSKKAGIFGVLGSVLGTALGLVAILPPKVAAVITAVGIVVQAFAPSILPSKNAE
jgi:hypothetical protein